MKKTLASIVFMLLVPLSVHAGFFDWFNNLSFGDSTINRLDQWAATTSPVTAITQRVYGKSFMLSGQSSGCAQFDGNGVLTTTGVACGSGGGTWATTSSDYWKTQRDFFSTTSVIYFAHSSTTIPKTYTSNTFTNTNTFNAQVNIANDTPIEFGGGSGSVSQLKTGSDGTLLYDVGEDFKIKILTGQKLAVYANDFTTEKWRVDSSGNVVQAGTLTVTGTSDGCATFSSGVLGSTGSACGAAAGSWATTSEAYYWSQFRDWSIVNGALSPTTTKGIVLAASSTISDLTTVNSTSTNATTTELYVSGTSLLNGAVKVNNPLAIWGGNSVVYYSDSGATEVGSTRFSASDTFNLGGASYDAQLSLAALGDTRTYTFPDQSGTFALTSDITGDSKWATSSLDSTAIHTAGASKVGVGTTSPYAKLSVQAIENQTNPVFEVASSSNATKLLTVTGSGDVLIMGNATGTNATKIGLNTTAGGTGAIAIGKDATAWSNLSMAIGDGSIAQGSGANAFGPDASANGANSYAIGGFSSAVGDAAMAVGNTAEVSSNRALSIGTSASIGTNSTEALALGYNVNVANDSEGSTAIGSASAVSGATYATAIGWGANIPSGANGSIALGYSAYTTAAGQLGIGGSGLGITDVYIGESIRNTTPAGVTIQVTGSQGTNINGVDFTVAGGKATGSGTGGNVVFSTSDPLGSGTTLQSLSEKARVTNNGFGIGTTTPKWALNIASSTRSQLTLSDGSLTSNHWSFRNAGGLFYLATSSPSTFATSTASAFSINANGIPAFSSLASCNTIDTDANGVLSCGTDEGGAGGDWATTSEQYYWSQFRDLSVQGDGYLAPTTTRGLILSASSTIANLQVVNGTTTNATSTINYSTRYKGPDGSFSAPVYTFGDTDTGLYTSGAGNVSIATNGASGIYSFGTAGLSISTGGLYIRSGGTSGSLTAPDFASNVDGDTGMSLSNDNTLRLVAGGVNRVFLNSDGNTGIASTSPWAKLSIGNHNGGATPLFAIASSSSAVATTTHFIVNQFGNVGIATTSPSQKLSISGNIYATGGATTTGLASTNLISCNTIDTDSNGNLLCGTDEGGAGGDWATTSEDYYWSQFRDLSVQGNGYLAPTTTRGLILSASSTISNLQVVNGTTTNATTTNLTISSLTSELLKVDGSGKVLEAISGTDYEVPLTFGDGLTRTANDVDVDTTQNIAKLSNLTSNGFVKTSGGDGTLSVDTTTYESGLTAGDGLTRTSNDFDCDTASGTVFGCLSSANWTTFNNKQDTITAGDNLTLTGTDIDLDATLTGMTAGTFSGLVTAGNFLATASSTFQNFTGVNATTTNATTTNLYVSGQTRLASLNGILKGTTGVVGTAANGTDYTLITATTCDGTDKVSAISADGTVTCSADQTGGGGAYPFALAGNATSTLTQFNGGLTAYASSTISDLQVINGTTTNATSTNLTVSSLSSELVKASASGLLIEAVGDTDYQVPLTFGDGLTRTANDIDFDGGATPAGDLGGTWADPTVDDDSHAHTGATLSGIDVSADTNLTAGTGITLTDDDLSIDTSQNIATLSNLTSNGFVKTSGGTGALSIDTNTYLTGNQTITLSGVISGSGATSITTAYSGVDPRGWNVVGGALTPTTTTWGILVNNASSTITNLMMMNSTSTNATSTNLSISGTLDLDQMTSALLLTGATGIVAEYTGTSCTNQFARSISALGVATCATVDISADTNLTAGDGLTLTDDDIDFDGGASPGGSLGGTWASPTIDDLFLFNNGDVGTGVFDFGGATNFELPNGTGPSFDAIGQVYYDTSDKQLKVSTTTSSNYAGVIPLKQRLWSGTVASSSVDFASGGRIPLSSWSDGVIITEVRCQSDGGTSKAINLDTLAGGANLDSVTCNTIESSDTAQSVNYTISAGTTMAVELGATTGAVDYVSFSVWGYIQPE